MGDLPEAFDRRLVWDIDSQTAPKRAAIRESAFQLAFGPVGFRIIAGRKIAGGGSIRFSPALSHRLQGQAVTERRGASSEFRAGPCKMGPAWSAPSPPKSCVCGLSKCFRPSASTPTTADGYLQIRCAFPFWVRDTKARTNAQPRLDVSSQPFYGWYSDARGTLPVHGLPARAEQAEGRERPHLPIAAPARRKTVGLLQVAGTIPEFREE